MTELTVIQRAQTGDIAAIAALMNASLAVLKIRVRTALNGSTLHVLFEADQDVTERPCLQFVQQGMARLRIDHIASAMIYHRFTGNAHPAWVQALALPASVEPPPPPPSQVTDSAPRDCPSEPGDQPNKINLINPTIDKLAKIAASAAMAVDESAPAAAAMIPVHVQPMPSVSVAMGGASVQTPAMSAIAQLSANLPPIKPLKESSRAIVRSNRVPKSGIPQSSAQLLGESQSSSLEAIVLPEFGGLELLLDRLRWENFPLLQKPDRLFHLMLLGIPIVAVLLSGVIVSKYLIRPAANLPSQQPTQLSLDPFQMAYRQAVTAQQMTHAAKSTQDWKPVIHAWEQAIVLMKAVPGGHPQHAIAQKKVQEYQQILDQVVARGGKP